MNRDDVIRMAQEACPYTDDTLRGAFYEGYLKGAAAEREECAKAAEGWSCEAAGDNYQTSGIDEFWDANTLYDQGRVDAAAAIRARGQS